MSKRAKLRRTNLPPCRCVLLVMLTPPITSTHHRLLLTLVFSQNSILWSAPPRVYYYFGASVFEGTLGRPQQAIRRMVSWLAFRYVWLKNKIKEVSFWVENRKMW
ncbi:hypothetical protein L596_027103 [Steinernema carpocapsae]|uniref:Uncharacterized protein n=1 Tax=Steinernema carpocapsae TaxID=34508 RepID=A0A4U5M3B9_STECR|nr:hypothetical protein L596_027103 [Steinernema carpocapsae]